MMLRRGCGLASLDNQVMMLPPKKLLPQRKTHQMSHHRWVKIKQSHNNKIRKHVLNINNLPLLSTSLTVPISLSYFPL